MNFATKNKPECNHLIAQIALQCVDKASKDIATQYIHGKITQKSITPLSVRTQAIKNAEKSIVKYGLSVFDGKKLDEVIIWFFYQHLIGKNKKIVYYVPSKDRLTKVK